jgi:serine/threonine protein kinase
MYDGRAMTLPDSLAPGTVFAHDFSVVRPLSQGGMGAVYVVQQLSTGALRALKLMHPQLVREPRQRQRFEQEARVGARIESDHVVQVLGAGVDDATGMPWLVMELLNGTDLAELIARRGPLPLDEVREMFAQFTHAVAAAHRVGIVHRDLKPENIFVAVSHREGAGQMVKVLDFGIAKVVAEAQASTTQALGTPIWMAPEQTETGRNITPAADVWALGLIAFRMLTGMHFWTSANSEAPSPTMVLREVVIEPIVSASLRAQQLGRGNLIPPGFDAWFACCVVRQPEARFANAGAARDAFASTMQAARGAASMDAAYAATAPAKPPDVTARAATPTPGATVAVPGYAGPPPAANVGGPPPAYGLPPIHGGGGPQYPYGLPPAPANKQPPPATASRGSAGWIAAATIPLLALAGLAAYFVTTAKPTHATGDDATTAAPAASAPVVPEAATTFVSRGLGRDVYGVDPVPASQAAGQWHFRVQRRDGLVDAVEHVAPNGRVDGRETFERAAGILTRRVIDARGVEAASETRSADGTVRFTARSGAVGQGGCHHWKVRVDDRDLPVRAECFDGGGHLVPDEEGCEVRLSTFDEARRETSLKCVQPDESPATFASGEHVRRFAYEAGRRVESASFGANDGPMVDVRGCAKKRARFTPQGDLAADVCLDLTGTVVREARRTADPGGCLTVEENFGPNGQPAAPEGVAARVFTRDDKCGEVRVEVHGVDGKPFGATQAPAVRERVFNAQGLAIEERCRDAKLQPVSCYRGEGTLGALVKRTFDDRGREILYRGFSADGAPTGKDVEFPHETRSTYGDDGRLRSVAWFDAAGKPGTVFGGAARMDFVYDSIGAELAKSFFGPQGAPVMTSLGCQELRSNFDEHHRVAAYECRGPDGNLSPARVCMGGVCWPMGSARVVVQRPGGEVFNVFQDVKGKELKRISCEKQACYR